MTQEVSDEDFIRLYTSIGAAATARRINRTTRAVNGRRAKLEEALDMEILAPERGLAIDLPPVTVRRTEELEDGVIIAFSDAHYYPNDITTAHKALLKLCKKLKPDIVVANGDIFDGASISRHPPINWETVPTVEEELKICQKRLGEIVKAAPSAKHYWPLGNHDARFESKLAQVASQFKGVTGMHLKDHFSDWLGCWSLHVNDQVVFKHRWKGGEHAAFNNTVRAGKTMVTGHTHRQLVRPYTDYNGTRYGVELGTLGEPYGPHMEYAEDNPRDHRSGFAVFRFHKGELLQPELVTVLEPGLFYFGGEVHEVAA